MSSDPMSSAESSRDRSTESSGARGGEEHVRRERDLYRKLLQLGATEDLRAFIDEALALVVEVSGARHGYFELRDSEDARIEWAAAGLSGDEVEDARAAVSRGIVARALSRGEPVVTGAARLDPRFASRKSVQAASIEAVLCVPIGSAPPQGVLYLERGMDEGSFSDEDRDRACLVAQHLAPFVAQRVAQSKASPAPDPTAEPRRKLVADAIIGRSEALSKVLREAALVAPLDVNTLLTGESGTGKSQLARVIHDSGPRRSGPFLALNCAALPAELLENELFGAERGAHSTAATALPGKIAEAEGGTLFLDEIAEMPSGSQAKLLQLLQTKEYFPLGASKPRRADVRVIAATNTDLEAAKVDGRFREDLYYRLCVVPIRMPTLKERRDDVADLAVSLCDAAVARHGLPHVTLSTNAIDGLVAAEWPGNVRQLQNVVEAAVIRAAGEDVPVVEQRHLFPSEARADDAPATLQSATRAFQRSLLKRTLEDSGWNVAETARRLDVARSYVYKLIGVFGLEREP